MTDVIHRRRVLVAFEHAGRKYRVLEIHDPYEEGQDLTIFELEERDHDRMLAERWIRPVILDRAEIVSEELASFLAAAYAAGLQAAIDKQPGGWRTLPEAVADA